MPLISGLISEFINNPHNKERADSTSPYNHTIVIDDHYWVNTTSPNESKLVYTEDPTHSISTYDEVFNHSVDKLNWTEDYILVGSKSRATRKYSYMILNRQTTEFERFANDKEFKRAKEEKGIDLEVLNKKYFDWY